jgi:hypothetical protein
MGISAGIGSFWAKGIELAGCLLSFREMVPLGHLLPMLDGYT